MAIHTEDRARTQGRTAGRTQGHTRSTSDGITVVADGSDAGARSVRNPAFQGFLILWVGFTAAPILFGLDQLVFHRLTDWTQYLAPLITDHSPWDASGTMMVIGAVEIVAGLLVAVRPRIGAYVVAAWLAGIIVNLLLLGNFYDVALRDFGLFLGALALARLATSFRPALLRSHPAA